MQPLKYARAHSLDEAVRLLQDNGPNARPLAGGTDIIVAARERRRDVDWFIDIKHVPELMSIESDNGGITVGASVPFHQLYADERVASTLPALAEATHVIGGKAIQGRASLGGNLCNSSPAADSIPAMMALGATVNIVGPGGERSVPVEDFCTGPGQNVLADAEIVVSIHFPAPEAGSGAAWERFIPRNEMDIAVVNSASQLVLDGDVVASARIALGAVAPTPLMVPAAAEALTGRPLTDETIEAAMAAARDAASPIDDMRGSVRQRKHLSAVLTGRTIRAAAERARG